MLFHPASHRALFPGLGPRFWERRDPERCPRPPSLHGDGVPPSPQRFSRRTQDRCGSSPQELSISPPCELRRRARSSFLPPSLPLSAGRVSARPWAWLEAAARAGLGVSHSAGGAESRARRHTEAAGAGGCGAASGRGRLAAAPRPPTHTCCRAAVSWSAASSPAAVDDLFARRQPLRSPGVPVRAGDAPSAARSPAQPARRAAASAAGSRSPGGAAP